MDDGDIVVVGLDGIAVCAGVDDDNDVDDDIIVPDVWHGYRFGDLDNVISLADSTVLLK